MTRLPLQDDMLVDVMPLLRRSWANLETSDRLLKASREPLPAVIAITTKSWEAVERSRRLLASIQAPRRD